MDSLVILCETFNVFSVNTLVVGVRVRAKAGNYSGPSLACLSTFKQRVRSSLALLLMLLFAKMLSMGSFSIFLSKSFSFLARQGVSAKSISQKMTPSAHISLLYEYSFFRRDSGAIQSGLPTLYLLLLLRAYIFMAKPKSAILIWFSCVRRMLAGFRSRWTICLLWNCRQP